ncbi:MAG: SxtJ family membrane protein [Candidatus Tantalella remota]|nr:SxtJ family membrane protein [Candidatus Tantalella remota]
MELGAWSREQGEMKKEVTKKDLRQFGIVLGLILGVFGGIHLLKGHTHASPWFLGFSGAALFTGIFAPAILKPVFIVFTKVAHAIGWFNTRVILILVYYLIVTPIGLIMKLFRKDPLNRSLDKEAETYWVKRTSFAPSKEALEKQF